MIRVFAGVPPRKLVHSRNFGGSSAQFTVPLYSPFRSLLCWYTFAVKVEPVIAQIAANHIVVWLRQPAVAMHGYGCRYFVITDRSRSESHIRLFGEWPHMISFEALNKMTPHFLLFESEKCINRKFNLDTFFRFLNSFSFSQKTSIQGKK